MPLPTIMRRWNLVRKDTLELLVGQFEAEDVTENVGAAYAETFTLGRQTAITQFLHGETDTVSFRGRVYDQTLTGGAFPTFDKPSQPILEQLKAWTRVIPELGRPPVLIFFIGNGFLQKQVRIETITGIKYDQPAGLGKFKGATFTVNLRAYEEFDINQSSNFDTRYHHALKGDYYELLAYREYKDPNLGVWLRQQHPTQPNLQTGNIVKLPSMGSPRLRRAKVTQVSTVFSTAYGRKPTPQRERRLEMLRLRGKARVSHVLLGDS